MNAVGLLSLDVETRGLPPLAPPPRVCGEVYLTLPYLALECSVEHCTDAMGIDVGHMSYPRLVQSIPPDYNWLRYAQCCAAIAKEHRKLNKAVRVVEAQLAKKDREIDAAAAEKIKTIQKATAEVLSKSKITGTDANALIKKVKGKNS